jgi:hypothetical protein
LNRRDFESEYQELLRSFSSDDNNPGSYQCEGCKRCASCMFCKTCTGCYRCTHCSGCEECSNCTACVDCESCHSCQHTVKSRLCTGSAYLVMCQNCSDCTYCFGCVGLSRKDFHVLNRPYSRAEYFALVKQLKAELKLP